MADKEAVSIPVPLSEHGKEVAELAAKISNLTAEKGVAPIVIPPEQKSQAGLRSDGLAATILKLMQR